jgi:phage terminase Nu1 subunit (DNA packaging protein)
VAARPDGSSDSPLSQQGACGACQARPLSARAVRPSDPSAETAAGRSGSALADARAKLATLQAAGQELRNASLRGETVPKADVVDTWTVLLRGVRQLMLAWPGKAAFELPSLTVADRAVLERIARDDLEDAALGRGFDLGAGEVEGPSS